MSETDVLDEALAERFKTRAETMRGIVPPDPAVIVRRARRQRRVAATSIAVVLAIVAGGGVVLSRWTGGEAAQVIVSSPDGSAAVTSTPIPPEEVRAKIESQMVDGWVPYWGDDALHPGTLSDAPQGWIRWGEPQFEPGKSRVYDRPNGDVVGYAYNELGFVPAGADSSFDAHAERIARFGCDQHADPGSCPIDPEALGPLASNPAASFPTADASDPAGRVLQGQMDNGWMPYSAPIVLDDYAIADEPIGWVRHPFQADPEGRVAVYDTPDGTLTGYNFPQLGFVAVGDVDGFDAHAERVARYGCDPQIEAGCFPVPKP